jgi:asparagine synthase (glutamine-hydrolysing)
MTTRGNLALAEDRHDAAGSSFRTGRILNEINTWGEFAGEAEWTDTGLTVGVEGPDGTYCWMDTDRQAIVAAAELYTLEEQRALAEFTKCGERDLLVMLRRLTGNFAFALLVPETQSVILATDHFGVQPLYYWSNGKRVVFATRLENVARLVSVPVHIDQTAVYHYLNFSYVPGPGTIYRDVCVLPPGSVLRCHRGAGEVQPYWEMNYPADATAPEKELAGRLRREIERAVQQTLPADRSPQTVGTFLSGGTDSGTISGLVSRELSPLRAYSIAFSEDAYNELRYARILANYFRLDHYIHLLTAGELLESIPLLVRACDQPLGNPSVIATWRCMKFAAETGIPLLLAGDGGDEIFGGNERYAKDYVYGLYHRLPAWSRRLLLSLSSVLPGNSFLGNRLRNFASRGNLSNPERFYADDAFAAKGWETLVHPRLRQQVSREASLDVVRRHYSQARAKHELDRLLYVDLQMAIAGNDLPKVLTAARITGVRVRFPFLDPGLAAFTGTLPPRYKVRGLDKRYLFKRAVADVLPRATLKKTKRGFGVPVAEWIRADPRVRAAILDPVLDSHSFVRECLTTAGLRRIVDDHLRGDWDYGTWLWALMMLERWMRARRDGQRYV